MSPRPREHEPSDAELVRQAQTGSSAAFAALVARYQERVFNTCYRMCHNEADALDLAQSTFLRALESLSSFRREANFYTWLFRIAINLVLSQRRTRQRRPTASLGAVDNPGIEAQTPDRRELDGATAAERHELHARVAWALEQLDDEFRAAVVLKDVEDMDYAAIAEVLAVPVGTVKSRIHRGRLMLRDLLRDERKFLDRAQAG